MTLSVTSCAEHCRFQVRKRVLQHHAVQLTGTRSDAIALGSEQKEDDREKKRNTKNASGNSMAPHRQERTRTRGFGSSVYVRCARAALPEPRSRAMAWCPLQRHLRR
jgi:hypothetical protein